MSDHRNDFGRESRKQTRYQRFGTNKPMCIYCGETESAALTHYTEGLICIECHNARNGRSVVEEHHVDGQHNSDYTIAIPANDHRFLSDIQQDWPKNTLRNPEKSPLLRAAAALRGFLDYLIMLAERALGWIPPLLEALDEYLTSQFGKKWWEGLDLQGGMR